MIRVSAFDDYIPELIQKYAIKKYLPEHEVRNILQHNVYYPSQVKGQQVFVNAKKQSFESNRDLIRARKYAKGDLNTRLEMFKEKLYTALDMEIEKAKEKEREAEEQAKKEYEEILSSSEAVLEEKAQQAAEKQEADYQESMRRLSQVNSRYQYLSLKTEFLSYGSYKDSEEMAKLCEEKAANYNKEKKANLERERAKFQTELAGLHGLFADKQRRKEVEKLIEWIDSEINKLT